MSRKNLTSQAEDQLAVRIVPIVKMIHSRVLLAVLRSYNSCKHLAIHLAYLDSCSSAQLLPGISELAISRL